MRVLVVEDDDIAALWTAEVLRDAGYEAEVCADGAAATAALEELRPDVVVLDLRLPGRSGLDLLADWSEHEDPVLRTTPVVVVSGTHPSLALTEALDAGAHDYLLKPARTEELLARVRAAARVKHLQDELRGAAARMAELARTDPLTELPNRRALEAALAAAAAGAGRRGGHYGVLLLDVDRFKHVNDAHGHVVGDAVLRELAQRLTCQMRTDEHLGRWGGEEFLAVVPDVPSAGEPAALAVLAHRLVDAVGGAPVDTDVGQLTLTVSCGYVRTNGQPHLAVQLADAALYEAKRAGGGVAVESSAPPWTPRTEGRQAPHL
jgi:two-component system, cell cycle response regulator